MIMMNKQLKNETFKGSIKSDIVIGQWDNPPPTHTHGSLRPYKSLPALHLTTSHSYYYYNKRRKEKIRTCKLTNNGGLQHSCHKIPSVHNAMKYHTQVYLPYSDTVLYTNMFSIKPLQKTSKRLVAECFPAGHCRFMMT